MATLSDIERHDVIVFGAGLSGLWIANRLKRAGYNVTVIEKDRIGGAMQGFSGILDLADEVISDKWRACFDGYGDINLTHVNVVSDEIIGWTSESKTPPDAGVSAQILRKKDYPEIFSRQKDFRGSVYRVPGMAVDMSSLVAALAKSLEGCIITSEMTNVLPDGQVAISDRALQARLIIFAMGAGNDEVFRLLKVSNTIAPPRPCRSFTLHYMDEPFFGHALDPSRIVVASHAEAAGYVWHISGAIGFDTAAMDDDAAIAHAKTSMQELFPQYDWPAISWTTESGRLVVRDDPLLHQRGRLLLAWPGRIELLPELGDRVMRWLKGKDILSASAPKTGSAAPVDIFDF